MSNRVTGTKYGKSGIFSKSPLMSSNYFYYSNIDPYILSVNADILFSNSRDNFYFLAVWFNNNIQDFAQKQKSSSESMQCCIMIYGILKVGHILQDSMPRLDPRVALIDVDRKVKSVECVSLLLIL